MMNAIYDALIADSFIKEKASGRIKFYEYPEAKDMKETHIIIDPLDVPNPGDYADNEWLTDDYLYQIDIWSKNMSERDVIAAKIREIMWNELNFRQHGGNGVDEWNKEFNIFRDARRYRGKAYRKDLNNL